MLVLHGVMGSSQVGAVLFLHGVMGSSQIKAVYLYRFFFFCCILLISCF